MFKVIYYRRNKAWGFCMSVKAIPLQSWSGPEGSRMLTFPDFVTTAQDGGKVVNLTHRPPLPPGNAPATHFCWRLSRHQGHGAIGRILCQWKIPMTPAGIELVTFRLVVQHLNHCATAVPFLYVGEVWYCGLLVKMTCLVGDTSFPKERETFIFWVWHKDDKFFQILGACHQIATPFYNWEDSNKNKIWTCNSVRSTGLL